MNGRGCRYLSALPVPSLMADCGPSTPRTLQVRALFANKARLSQALKTTDYGPDALQLPDAPSSLCNVFHHQPNARQKLANLLSPSRSPDPCALSSSLAYDLDTRSDSRVRGSLEHAEKCLTWIPTPNLMPHVSV